MKTVFVVGGSPEARQPRQIAPANDDLIIAADKGAEHARTWGWRVDWLIGDLDSLPQPLIEREVQAGTRLVRVPPAKDQTDLELALELALVEHADRIVISGALGGRTDHLLANVLLLARADLAGLDVCLAHGNEALRLLACKNAQKLPVTLTLQGEPGDILTLLPLLGEAKGVTTHGLEYPLRAETLHVGEARGVSNVFVDEEATVGLREGSLLVAHIARG